MRITNPRPAVRAALIEQFKNLRNVRVGDTRYLGDSPDIAGAIKRALNRGETVTENGVDQWIDEVEVYDPTKEGLAALTWHRDRKRVKVERFLCTRAHVAYPAIPGPTTKASLGFAWRDYRKLSGC